jgi:hypothetical protein
MFEFASVSASSYDAASLSAKLTEKSADGWEVVAIVPTGGDITAFLRRTAGTSTTVASSSSMTTTTTEPAGWGVAPQSSAPTATTPAATATVIGASQPAATTSYQPVAQTPVAQTPATSTPATPAGWYHDPSGRFELRYWDGTAWTEHVARGGQQYTDPPVA